MVQCEWLGLSEPETTGKVLAFVDDHKLYAEDLEGYDFQNLSDEDSIKIIHDYTENWVRHNLLFAYASKNLPKEKLDIEKQIKEYRESLMINTYQQEYVKQHLDTVVDQTALKEFYRENPGFFRLDKMLYRVRFVMLPNDSQQKDEMEKKMRSNSTKANEWLEVNAAQYALLSNFNDSTWYDKDQLGKYFPLEILNSDRFSTLGYFSISEGEYTYIGRIIDRKVIGDREPISFASDRIRRIIIKQRQRDLVDELNNKIFNDAASRGTFEIY